MSKFNLISIDLAKNVFQVGKFLHQNLQSNKAVSRKELLSILTTSPRCKVVMESCGGAHYWARKARSVGHEVVILDPRFVKAFRVGQKTDANDVIAIAAASFSPNVRPCKSLTQAQQSLQSIERMRALAEKQKRQLANQIRGLLLEFGIVIKQSECAFRQAIPEILEDSDNGLTAGLRQCLAQCYELFKAQSTLKETLNELLTGLVKQDEQCERLLELEGVGPITAVGLLISLSDTTHFTSGRNAAANVGVTPRQHSSGGKVRIGHIAKYRGEITLRSYLFLGARAVISQLKHREPKTKKEQWLKALVERRGVKCAAIALANKTVRTAYAMLKKGTSYEPSLLAN